MTVSCNAVWEGVCVCVCTGAAKVVRVALCACTYVAFCCSHFCTLLSSEPNADADVPDHVRLDTEPVRLLPPHDGWLPSLAERAHAQPPLWVHATRQQAQYSTRADGHGCGRVAHDQSQRCWRAHGRVAEDAAADPIPAGERAPLEPNVPTVSIPFVAHSYTVSVLHLHPLSLFALFHL